MKNDFEIRRGYKEYLNENIPELGNILLYLDDPLKTNKTRACLVPWESGMDSSSSAYAMELFVFIAESSHEKITEQMDELASRIKETVFSASAPAPGTVNIEQIVPTPGASNIGIMRALIRLTAGSLCA